MLNNAFHKWMAILVILITFPFSSLKAKQFPKRTLRAVADAEQPLLHVRSLLFHSNGDRSSKEY